MMSLPTLCNSWFFGSQAPAEIQPPERHFPLTHPNTGTILVLTEINSMPAMTIKNIPDDLYSRLKEAAQTHHRSMNSEPSLSNGISPDAVLIDEQRRICIFAP